MEEVLPQGRDAHPVSLSQVQGSMRTTLRLRHDYSNELERLQIFEAM